ncbi:MAG: pyridoxamine kinase [Clostridia bacterium]
MNAQKRVMALHDISCFGRCSLTVALPIISAVGYETAVIPTAVLSTHTGGFENYTYRDLTEDIEPIARHWQSLSLGFDAIYSGFLGSFRQIEIVKTLFEDFKTEDNIILVDPVMGDNGKLYSVFSKDFPQGMRTLCQNADIIVPNITEAVLMLDEEYREGPYTQSYIEILLKKLAAIGAKKVVLTGVYFDDIDLGAASYDAESGLVSYSFSKRIEGYYHGTGDVFGSALLGALLSDKPLETAVKIAVDFTTASIARTKAAGTDVRFGVNFEEGLGALIAACK